MTQPGQRLASLPENKRGSDSVSPCPLVGDSGQSGNQAGGDHANVSIHHAGDDEEGSVDKAGDVEEQEGGGDAPVKVARPEHSPGR